MSAVLQEPAFALRRMRDEDVPAVVVVERAAYPHPWTEGIFRDCLRVGYSCWVVEQATETVGHGIMQVAAGESHILNLCVHPQWQRRRLGRKILRRLLAVARAKNADTAFLEVRASNQPAVGLYESEGFCEVGVRRGYYPAVNGREDAIIMAKSL
ncbi:MAG: ribosomal protein S18-alanine N-acetyltransferase [Chromatiaceae bacterium]|jgi:[ribosomal protein S18]-alanine N-acetyltransferase